MSTKSVHKAGKHMVTCASSTDNAMSNKKSCCDISGKRNDGFAASHLLRHSFEETSAGEDIYKSGTRKHPEKIANPTPLLSAQSMLKAVSVLSKSGSSLEGERML